MVSAPPATSVRDVARLMRERGVGSVVLVEQERPVGLLTDRDLALSVVADGRDGAEPASRHASSPVVTARPECDLRAAAELMDRHGVRRLVVVDGERAAGILALDDLTAGTGLTDNFERGEH